MRSEAAGLDTINNDGLALRRALTVLRDNDFRYVTLASDCLSLIQRVSSTAQDRSRVGSVVMDIENLASGFRSCSFKHVARTSNLLAHRLARFSELSYCNISFGVIPDVG